MKRGLNLMLLFLATGWPLVPAWGENTVSESVITATFPDRSISALVTHLEPHRPFVRGILLMPGSPGIMKLQSPESFTLKGNFLIRSRSFWLDEETVVFSVDAPNDEWRGFGGGFRRSPRYAEDMRALVAEIDKRFGTLSLAVVGTSEGSVSAYYVAKALDPARTKVIFTSSLFNNSNNVPGLASLDFDDFKTSMLWVHHAGDACPYTPYWQAKRHADKTRSPLITVKSSNTGRGHDCEAFSRHGYAGAEKETVQAMKQWLVTGVAADVVLP